MQATQGLFSALTPEAVQQAEEQKRLENNLQLATSSNPFASTMFTGLNLADNLRTRMGDIFGNPVPESAAVKQAREEQDLQSEVAKMVMEGRQQGKDNATIAQEVQQYLLSRGKLQKAEQVRQQQIAEEQTASKTAAEVDAKKASAEENRAKAAKAMAEVAFQKTTVEDRIKALKTRFPNISEDVAKASAVDKDSFADMMVGKNVETQEGVFMVRPDGSKERIGSPVQRAANVSLSVGDKGNEAYVKKVAETIPDIETAIDTNNAFISQLRGTMKRASETIKNKDRYTGGLGEGMTAVASTLNSLGLLSPAEKDKLIKTQMTESEVANLLLSKTGGKIGAGFSNTDLETVKAGIGKAMNDPKALFEVLGDLERIAKSSNDALRKRQQRAIKSIQEGKPLPLDETFDTPAMDTRGTRIIEVPKDRDTPQYRAYLESQGYVVKVK